MWSHPYCTHIPLGQEQVPLDETHERCCDEFWCVWLGDWLYLEPVDPKWIHSSQDQMVLSLCLVREMEWIHFLFVLRNQVIRHHSQVVRTLTMLTGMAFSSDSAYTQNSKAIWSPVCLSRLVFFDFSTLTTPKWSSRGLYKKGYIFIQALSIIYIKNWEVINLALKYWSALIIQLRSNPFLAQHYNNIESYPIDII
jgi:hypothetical protein